MNPTTTMRQRMSALGWRLALSGLVLLLASCGGSGTASGDAATASASAAPADTASTQAKSDATESKTPTGTESDDTESAGTSSASCPPTEPAFNPADSTALSDHFTYARLHPRRWKSLGTYQWQDQALYLPAGESWFSNAVYTAIGFDRAYGDISVELDYKPSACPAAGAAVFWGPPSVVAAPFFQVRTDNVFLSGATETGESVRCIAGHAYQMKMVIGTDGRVTAYAYDKALHNAYPSVPTARTAIGAVTRSGAMPVSVSTYRDAGVTIDNFRISQSTPHPTVPGKLIAVPGDDAMLLQWDAVGPKRLVEYRPSGSACGWSPAPAMAPAGSMGYTVRGLKQGIRYDFRVRTQGLEQASAIVSETTTRQHTAFLNQVLSTGQSLSVGATSAVSLTTSQPDRNLMLTADSTDFIPLVAPYERQILDEQKKHMQSMSPSLYNFISQAAGSDSPYYQGIVSEHGISGKPYSDIRKYGTLMAYENGQAQMRAAGKLSTVGGHAQLPDGKPYRVAAVTLVHGEADQIRANTSQARYLADLVEMQSDYQRDARAFTGVRGAVPLFLNQRWGSACSYLSQWPANPETGSGIAGIALAQWQAGIQNPGRIFVVAPTYAVTTSNDNCHLTSEGYRRLGEYYGKVIKKVVVDKQDWKPLSPRSVTLNGKVIDARFHVPVQPLVFDNYLVDPVVNQGFEYFDDACTQDGSAGKGGHLITTCGIKIQSVTIVANDTVRIVLSALPDPAKNPRLRYAWGTPNFGDAAPHGVSPHGNLRDSDTTPALAQYCDGYVTNTVNGVPNALAQPNSKMGCTLYNWGLTFDAPIPSSYEY